jgi:hypothetical protein
MPRSPVADERAQRDRGGATPEGGGVVHARRWLHGPDGHQVGKPLLRERREHQSSQSERQVPGQVAVRPRHVGCLCPGSEVAASEIEKGEDFVIPGVAKLTFTYRKPQKKGQRWKKGDTVTGFGGIEAVKDEDSPAVKAAIKLKAVPTGKVARLKPGSKPEAQSDFLKSKAGRNVARRRG